RFPEVWPLASTADVARLLSTAALGAVLHEEAVAPLAELEPPPAGDVVLVVGPEGGIAPAELEAFSAAGAAPYRLGPTVLRTSTAGVAALAVLLAGTSRWR
ncbi:MAG: RsmE family RNA methyltransferase, partial [Actinomycetota bacterium]|nr:RsmE family RNA methyltransferase [Actinomycetota bacterium]